MATRVFAQLMSQPTEGAEVAIKRVIQYLQKYPRAAINFSDAGGEGVIRVWRDSGWAGDTDSRRSCSGGWTELEGPLISHWSKLQSNITLSCGEAELNAAVNGISEGVGVVDVYRDMFGIQPPLDICADDRACKGMLLRIGAGTEGCTIAGPEQSLEEGLTQMAFLRQTFAPDTP